MQLKIKAKVHEIGAAQSLGADVEDQSYELQCVF
jgi:hypothetical protein